LDVPQSVIVKMGQNAIFDMDFGFFLDFFERNFI